MCWYVNLALLPAPNPWITNGITLNCRPYECIFYNSKIYLFLRIVHWHFENISFVFAGPDGIIIVDTTESETACQKVYKEFRKISEKPLKAIIITHFHAGNYWVRSANWTIIQQQSWWAVWKMSNSWLDSSRIRFISSYNFLTLDSSSQNFLKIFYQTLIQFSTPQLKKLPKGLKPTDSSVTGLFDADLLTTTLFDADLLTATLFVADRLTASLSRRKSIKSVAFQL